MGRSKRASRKFNLPPGRNSSKYKRQNPYTGTKLKPNTEQTPNASTSYFGKTFHHAYASQNLTDCKLLLKKVEPPTLDLGGNRVLNILNLSKEIERVTNHVALCSKAIELAQEGKTPFKFLGVGKTAGLSCFLHSRCLGCGKKFVFGNSKKMEMPLGNEHYDVNVRGVWGQMSTGGGGTHHEEQMATLGIPTLTFNNFSKIEDDVRVWWKTSLDLELAANAAAEKQLAIDNNQFHEGVPAITVIADGGWCKRTHKHSYNALAGVAVIFGAKTGKLLHVGVHSKYCSTCSWHEGKGKTPPKHECLKDWTASSQSMESDIILEGFWVCEEKFGLRYIHFIGDGDSSTFSKIISQGPPWCRHVTKIECANHACKCLRTHLEKLVQENPKYKGKHGLTKAKRAHIVAYIRYAIKCRSMCVDKCKGAMLLKSDIKTSMWHVFGNHSFCSGEICKDNVSISTESSYRQIMPDEDIYQEQPDYCQQSTSTSAQEFSRTTSSRPTKPVAISQFVIQDVSLILNRMAEKAESLITNSTTNICESWMALRAKFDGGKQVNRCGKGSWHARCYGAALRSSIGPEWSTKIWSTVSKQPPDKVFVNVFQRKATMLTSNKRITSNLEYKRRAIKRKYARMAQSQTKKARLEYGSESIQVSKDVGPKELQEACLLFWEENVRKSEEALQIIEQSTKQQSLSGSWHRERFVRVTSSNFSAIVKRKENSSTVPLVRRFLYSTFKGNKYTEYGLVQEERTIAEYTTKMSDSGQDVLVENSGLVVSATHPFLACSPDGLVKDEKTGQTGIIEVKNVLMGKNMTLREACKSVKSFCLKLNEEKLELKISHPYYMQCQGLLAICHLPWLDFVVRTTNPPDIHIERIRLDVQLWNGVMLPKLATFYFESLLPELASPRNGKDPGIRGRVEGLNAKLVKEAIPLASNSLESIPLTANTKSTVDCNNQGANVRSGTRVRFRGKRIEHKWVLDEATNQFQWYNGEIVRVIKGRDGTRSAVYEVSYTGDQTLYELSRAEIVEDLEDGSLKFVD